MTRDLLPQNTVPPSEQETSVNVGRLVTTLRYEASQMDPKTLIHKADNASIIRRISDEVAVWAGVVHVKPDIYKMTELLSQQIYRIEPGVTFQNVGTVQHIGNGVATLSGLPQSRTDELVTFPTAVQGLILNLEHDSIDVILLGSAQGIQGGDLVTATGERLRVPVGVTLLSRIIDPLGRSLDDRGPVEYTDRRYLESEAPSIITRAPVNESLLTGWKMVDALIPIGRGQRELIIGDRQTGKTTLAIDAILSQKNTGIACVYVAVGQKKSSTLAAIETLRRFGAMNYTTVVVSSPDDPPALRYLAPYTGCTIAESIMQEGRDVLIVYDDLTKHADAYRELSLLLRRPPGREAYPGDIFYLHSRLLERACKLSEAAGGGSITALPIVETQRGNMSAYIPTNLISITDGQIVLDHDMFNRGIKPAIDAGRSVSRVGGAAQTTAMRQSAKNLRLELAQFEEVARFARFGTEVDEATQQQIRRGERLQRLLTQSVHRPLSLAAQVILLQAASRGYLDHVTLLNIPSYERALLTYIEEKYPALLRHIERHEKITSEIQEMLVETMENFRIEWQQRRTEA